MTDLLARLRAVNPVPACDPPTLDAVWRRLQDEDQVPGPEAPEVGWPGPRRVRGAVFRASRLILGARHLGVGIAVALPVLVVAGLAVALVGSGRPSAGVRPGSSGHRVTRSSHIGAMSAIDAALARGIRPPAPEATLALPLLGSSATRTLKSFRGTVVLLNVFASWCRPCQASTTALEQAQVVIAGQRATVLGVTYEDRSAAATAFVHAHDITYPVLSDRSGRLARAFGVNGVPETFVIDRHGRIAAAAHGPVDGRWLTSTLNRVLAAEHLIPAGLSLKTPPPPSELAAMAKAYPVLGRAQLPADVPSSGVLDPYVSSQGGLGLNSRRALVTPSGESLYIVPAHQAMCVTSSDRVVEGCQPFPNTPTTPADIAATLCAPNLPSTELEVAGLMPPDASQIRVHFSNGAARAVTSTNGMVAIYARRAGPLPISITWMSPRGPGRAGTAVPPDAGSTTCAS